MQVTINGEAHDIEKQTVKQLLETLDIDPRKVAVELNMEILPKTSYETTPVTAGDRMEIVHFVGGG
jgi:thiamine biosynthesis protein ThiS